MSIECYTVITGGKDKVVEQDFPITRFIDAYDKFVDPRRNSRIQKILAHKYFDSEYTIYLDGNLKLLISPEKMVEKYMKGYDMALFKHGTRDCIYDEALEVAQKRMDDTELIIEQAKHYEDNEFAPHKGLFQGGFIIRRNNARTRRFNEAWWADFCRYSRRDQLSLMPAIEESGVIVNTIPGKWVDKGTHAEMGNILRMEWHFHKEGNFNDPKK
jgi:hypothetical protein